MRKIEIIDAQTNSTSAQRRLDHHLTECRDILKLSLGLLPTSFSAMDLPSSRELELEALLRQRDKQVAELSVSFHHLPKGSTDIGTG